jgi:hypothetical protein
VEYRIKFSNMPDSDHWLTNAQTHITGSSIIAFIMFCAYSSRSRALVLKLDITTPQRIARLYGAHSVLHCTHVSP